MSVTIRSTETVAKPLRVVRADLSDLVELLSRRWQGKKRWSAKRAEVESLLSLYREVLIIVDRLEAEGIPAMQAVATFMKKTPPAVPSDWFMAITEVALARVRIDVKSLYHWSYSVERFLEFSSAKDEIDLSELRRISIFRHKLMVHHAETPMRSRGHVPLNAQSWVADSDKIRIVAHPIRRGSAVWRARGGVPFGGYRRRIARLYPYVPGLKEEGNLWSRTDLIYRHFNRLPAGEQKWVRDVLFGGVGLQSDPPGVIVQALLAALSDYRRIRRI